MGQTTTPTRSALPIRPMNDEHEPIAYPLAGPSSLSADAQEMYVRGRGLRLDRDLFDPTQRHKFVPRDNANAFQPTERMLAAIAELEDVRLASYSDTYGPQLQVTRVHEDYTYAQGRGSQFIKVSVFDEHPEEAQLLAVLIGGDLESREARRGQTSLVVRSRHEDATDVEHDASSTAALTVQQLSQPEFGGYGRVFFTGVLTDARLYPIGTDPLKQDDFDPSETCDRCEQPHPFAPFQPPVVRSLSGMHFVRVEAMPLRPYMVEAPVAP